MTVIELYCRINYSYFLKNFLQLTFVLKLTIDFEHFFACKKKDEEKETQPSDTISVAKKRKQPAADNKTKEKTKKKKEPEQVHTILCFYTEWQNKRVHNRLNFKNNLLTQDYCYK